MTVQTAAPPTGLPDFPVDIVAPNLARWREGNGGIPGFWHFTGPAPGPHVVITALIHGNEIAGAAVLDQMLAQGPAPLRGRLTLGLVNLDAYDRFDPAHPTTSRYVDEDMNRLWDEVALTTPRATSEFRRAQAIRRVIDSADILLDLHSMLWPSEPLILSGGTERGRALAAAIGTPGLIIRDHGHASGRRLIDYTRFTAPGGTAQAVLVEAGQHWQAGTIAVMQQSVAALMHHTGLATACPKPGMPRFAEVTVAVTACTGHFTFIRPFCGGDIVPARGTLIAIDGDMEIRTPHDDCLLVMPSLRPSRGHTAVRLARLLT